MRILPTYYASIFIAIIMGELLGFEYSADSTGLGWLRYFTGLNMIIPSNDIAMWNNIYGWWTMSCFIGFYLMIPLILKLANNFWKAVAFLPISYVIAVMWKLIRAQIFIGYFRGDQVTSMNGFSPFETLTQFSLGIIAFFAIKERKINYALLVSSIFAILALVLNKDHYAWCAITAILVISLRDIKVDCCKTFWTWLAKNSYYIYLLHLLCIKISQQFSGTISFTGSFWVMLISFLGVGCLILNGVDSAVSHLVKVNDQRRCRNEGSR